MKPEQLIEKAKAYVAEKADYETNAYDVFCECYSQEEWSKFIKNENHQTGEQYTMTKWSEVKALIDSIESIHADRRADARNGGGY